MSIYKNGNVTGTEMYEHGGVLMNNVKSVTYVPRKDTNNSTLTGESIAGFEGTKRYYIELLISWDGFQENVADNFDIWAQGSTFNKNDNTYYWSSGNSMCTVVNKVLNKDLVLSAKSGSKFVSGFFNNKDDKWTRQYLGVRSDYSNGIGRITFSNIKVMPAEYAIDNSTKSGSIASDKIVAIQIEEV
jgi:hypothetical protein|nr:MAG TPA: hypothetical protein [Caudoviricetes sp.]